MSRMRTLTSRIGTSAPSKSDLLELPGGGEPPFAEYESAVLPLNYGSVLLVFSEPPPSYLPFHMPLCSGNRFSGYIGFFLLNGRGVRQALIR